ncbi:hypothetical protein Tco_0206880 [Tanacetum coccineum]
MATADINESSIRNSKHYGDAIDAPNADTSSNWQSGSAALPLPLCSDTLALCDMGFLDIAASCSRGCLDLTATRANCLAAERGQKNLFD